MLRSLVRESWEVLLLCASFYWWDIADHLIVVCLIHSFTPRLGIWLSNGFGVLKLVLLLLLVCTGFAALGGRTVAPRPDNFSSFHGGGSSTTDEDNSSVAAAGYALALLQVLYSYSGWENANYVSLTKTKRKR